MDKAYVEIVRLLLEVAPHVFRTPRFALKGDLIAALSERHRKFLVSVVKSKPEWDLMTCPHLAKMPAIRWKLANLDNVKKSNVRKFRLQADELLKRFEAIGR